MTFEDAMDEEATVTRKQAEHECHRHCCDVAEMVMSLGDKPVYQAREVLVWLGY